MTELLSAEWLRIRRNWLTWAIFGVLLFILLLQVNGKVNERDKLATEIDTGLSELESRPLTDMQIEGNRLLMGRLEQDLRYPANIGTIATLATGPGWFLVILFTAVIGGEDFTRGTLRSILSRGMGHIKYLLMRCLALWLVTGAAVLVITLIVVILGPTIHSRVTTETISFEGFGKSFLYALRSWLTYLPFIVVTLFWTVQARNAGPAMGLNIILHTFGILMGFGLPVMMFPFLTVDPKTVELPIFFKLLEFMSKILSITLGYNAEIFLNWGIPYHMNVAHLTSMIGIEGREILPTSQWRSLTILGGYILLFFGWSLRNFRRRDITYGS